MGNEVGGEAVLPPINISEPKISKEARRQVQGVIFSVDTTLINSVEVHEKVIRKILQELDINNISSKKIQRAAYLPLQEMATIIAAEVNSKLGLDAKTMMNM
ncbi:hypothetical protein AAMO2058_000061200 [Amorphochlora amoebiformis]